MVQVTRARSILGMLERFVPGAFRDNWTPASVVKLSGKTKKETQKELSYELPVDPDKIEEVLTRYGINGQVVDFRIGPSVTTFEVKVNIGTRVSQIERYREDMARDLQCPSLRIVKTVRDSSLLGLEVANTDRFTVYLKELMEKLPKSMRLPVAMGEDTYGQDVFVDLADAPHMLVAGQTGSGKSVFINTTVAGLLLTKTPQDVRFLIVDPKQVEFVAFEDVPHLERPIASDPEEARELLDYAVEEMERRFGLLREYRAKKIEDYNQKARERLPYIVFVVDEFADLLDGCLSKAERTEVEVKISRIAQKARAVGIHMILATQKPLASVMTSRIKANMPARVAFSVASGIDSRVILDECGAETLTGMGDMLYRNPNARSEYERLHRIQAPWVSESDIETIAKGGE